MAMAMERRWWRPQIRRRRGGRRWAAHAGIPRLPLAFSGTPLASAGIGGEENGRIWLSCPDPARPRVGMGILQACRQELCHLPRVAGTTLPP
ncbi:hypothetical protein OsJ_01985 [Oryza sativa Japonica Group]|uniref:Uncharacterized protein n=1 Tax=Oryza sativa subsp. japonica TaxID=39947 RepID=A2ZTQ6_ORYSJ|nr:hypothetical protein OsJ_01985 [Oryza sativa Japonica Group]